MAVEVFWGIVEGAGPGKYDWSAYKQLLHLIRDEGFTAQVRGVRQLRRQRGNPYYP